MHNDTSGIIYTNRTPFFPISAYIVSWDLTPDSIINNLRQLRNDGFNSAHISLHEDEFRILDSAQALGLKVVCEGGDTNRVSSLRNHPALLAWTIRDEPDLNGVGRDSLVTIHQTYKFWDRNHPTISCISDSSKYKEYAGITDIMAIDPYLNAFTRIPVSFVARVQSSHDHIINLFLLLYMHLRRDNVFPSRQKIKCVAWFTKP